MEVQEKHKPAGGCTWAAYYKTPIKINAKQIKSPLLDVINQVL
jgi:hypothetical protein